MAYDIEQLCHSGGTSKAPRYHTYHTDDNKVTATATGYFNSEHVRLRVNDIITIVNTNDVYDVIVRTVTKNFVEVELEALIRIGFVEYHLPPEAIPATVALNSDGVTYTKIPGLIADPANRFSLTGDRLFYSGVGGNFLLTITSSIESNKVANMTYSLFKNGVIVDDEQVTLSFTSANKRKNLALTGILELVTSDILSVRAKGDGTAGHELIIYKLDCTLMGI